MVPRGDRRQALSDRRHLVADRDRRDHDLADSRRRPHEARLARRFPFRESTPTSSTRTVTKSPGHRRRIPRRQASLARHAARHLGRPAALQARPTGAPTTNTYFPGDGAHRDKQGYFWIMGRIDDVMNVSGHRIGTMEVESALVSSSGRRRGRGRRPARRDHGHRDRRIRDAEGHDEAGRRARRHA